MDNLAVDGDGTLDVDGESVLNEFLVIVPVAVSLPPKAAPLPNGPLDDTLPEPLPLLWQAEQLQSSDLPFLGKHHLIQLHLRVDVLQRLF